MEFLVEFTVEITTFFSVKFTPHDASPRKVLSIATAGWPAGSTVYAHYVLGGRVRATRRLGAAQGPCGLLTYHSRLIPLTRVAAGKWTIQFDTSNAYRRNGAPYLAENAYVFYPVSFG
jgi:hypothetical protein